MGFRRIAQWMRTVLSTLIMVDVLILVSPFAFYWYSLDASRRWALHRTRWTKSALWSVRMGGGRSATGWGPITVPIF